MKKLYKLLLILFCFYSHGKLSFYDLSTQETLEKKEFLERVDGESQFVFGEFHYQNKIQKAQSEVMGSIVEYFNKQGQFQMSWEFLNFPDQVQIQNAFMKFKRKKVSENELLNLLFLNSDRESSYIPLLKELRRLQGQLRGVNAPRKWKRVITSKGLSFLEKDKLPPNMEIGSTHYFERFEKVMGGHVGGDSLMRYFEAQSYTDSVMAHQISLKENPLDFLIVGSFHSDYSDGVVDSLKKVLRERVYNLKFIDISKMSFDEVETLKKPHLNYGNIADFLVFIK